METNLFIGGVPLVLLVFGMVEFIKKLGVSGNWLTIASMILGVLFGLAYQVSAAGALPAGIVEWIVTLALGLALGLTASGIYDFLSVLRRPAA